MIHNWVCCCRTWSFSSDTTRMLRVLSSGPMYLPTLGYCAPFGIRLIQRDMNKKVGG
jgi:hypothetical protein